MKKRLSYSLKSLWHTVPISLILFIVFASWVLSNNEVINYNDSAAHAKRELQAVIVYALCWGIPVVTLIWRFINYSENNIP